jgi:hypothetical protein
MAPVYFRGRAAAAVSGAMLILAAERYDVLRIGRRDQGPALPDLPPFLAVREHAALGAKTAVLSGDTGCSAISQRRSPNLGGLSLKLLCPNAELLFGNVSRGARHHVSHSLRKPQEKRSVHKTPQPPAHKKQTCFQSVTKIRRAGLKLPLTPCGVNPFYPRIGTS